MDQTAQTQLATQLTQELYARYTLSVSSTWLASFLSAVRQPPPPLLALASTAHFRLLNCDFTRSLSQSPPSPNRQQSNLLPHNITDVNMKQVSLQVNVPVQVLDILDVGSSRYSQIEAIERVERGEEVRGREVIRNVPIMNDEDGSNPNASSTSNTGPAMTTATVKKSSGPHKLLLQDAAGTKVWGFELVSVPKIHLTTLAEDGGLQIGAKILLKKGVVVRRGLLMLEPNNVMVMGGKVEEWDKKWRVNRKARLTEEMKKDSEQNGD